MNRRLTNSALLALLVCASLGGCQSDRTRLAYQEPMPELVMPGTELVDAEDWADSAGESWAMGRNDSTLGGLPGREAVILDLAEIRHREYLWTSNGRPNEHSTTYTRTIERRIGR